MTDARPGTRFLLPAAKPYREVPLLNGPFVDYAATAFFTADSRGQASAASVTAETGATAVTARRPGTGYAVDRGAKLIPGARRILPDRAFDQLMTTTLRTP